MSNIHVTHSDGTKEPLNYDRINQMVENKCNGLEGVSPSLIASNAIIQMYDGIPTSEIQSALTKSAVNLITEFNPNYQYAAAQLFLDEIYTEVFHPSGRPKPLYDFIKDLIEKGFYDPTLLEVFSKHDVLQLEEAIDFERDKGLSYSAIRQIYDKYIIQDRVNNIRFEVPQYTFMVMAMGMHLNETKDKIKHVVEFYDEVSLLYSSMPTPIMGGVRGKVKQYASCCLIPTGDSLKSINAASDATVLYGSKRAGIGVDAGDIRALKSKVGDGSTYHTGIFPFLKYMLGSLKSISQGSLRQSSSTMFYSFWHYEVESLVVLKNNRGTEENRIRHSDYGIKLNRLFYQRAMRGEKLTLFSPHEVPDLNKAFHSNDFEQFEKLYKFYETNPLVRKKEIDARELFELIINERSSTGRIYILNIDHANTNSPFDSVLASIRQSNLCMEILLPNKPFTNSIEDGYKSEFVIIHDKQQVDEMIAKYGFVPNDLEGKLYSKVKNIEDLKQNIDSVDEVNVMDDTGAEIALCILAAINLGKITDIHDGQLEKTIYRTIRALDNLIDLQEYPVKAGEISAKLRRTLGLGVSNFAYYLAKNGKRYSDGSAKQMTHELFEAIQYYAIKASVSLAKERGQCHYFNQTTYSKGIMPVDRYNKNVDEIAPYGYLCDWDSLRQEVLTYGMRHSTLTALMPVESSAKTTSCFKFDTTVPTNKGDYSFESIAEQSGADLSKLYKSNETQWFEVKDLFVTNKDNEKEPITGVYYNGHTEVDEIEMDDGTIYKCTPNHKFLINRDGKEQWVKTKDLVEGDDVITISE